MKKLKILRNVLSFIALSHKNTPSEGESPREDYSPDTLAIKKILDPNNINLPEPNFEEFEKVSDFSSVKQRKSIYNNQLSLLSSDSSEALLKKSDSSNQNPLDSFQKKTLDSLSPPNNNSNPVTEFKIKVLPLPETNTPHSGSMGSKSQRSYSGTGYMTPNNAKERSQSIKSNTPKFTGLSPRKGDQKTSLRGFMGNETPKNEEGKEDSQSEKSEESEEESEGESISKGGDSSEGFDVIEEEDGEDDEETPKDTNTAENMPLASELMSNRDNNNGGTNPNVTADESKPERRNESPSSMVPEDPDEIQEVDTLEEEISPNLDLEALLDVIDDNQNLGGSQKLRKKKQYKNYQWILYPDDSFKSLWSILLSLVLAYTCLVTPYRVAFLSSVDNTQAWYMIDWVTDSIFWFDILVNFLSAYYDNNDNLIVEKRTIVCNYLSGWFFPDVVGVLPFDYILNVTRYGNLVRVAKLPRLYKLVRMTKMIRVLKLIKERNTVIKYLMDIFSIGQGFERLFVSICSIFVFCHLACCFWFMAADLNDNPINWVQQYNLIDKDNFDLYIASFYWITQTVVTVGYGDIAAVNTIERIMACLYMFVGVFFYSFTIGSLSSLLSSLDSKNATFDQKLNTLIQIRNQYNIDNLLYNRLKRALKYGTTQKDDEKMTFLNELPLNLRIELSVIMHKNVVQGIEFFKNKPPTFIALIGPYLKPFHIGKDEYIFHEGEYADEMYFIKEGDVAIVLKEFNNFEFMTIAKGYHFGEVDLLFGDTRKYTYMASTDVELLALSKKDFTKIFFSEFRDIGCEIFTNAHKRRLRSAKYHKEAIEFCQKQADKKKSYYSADRSVKSSIYGFRPQLSIAKKSQTNMRDSELFSKFTTKTENINNGLEIPQAQEQEIKESEEKARLIEEMIGENTTSQEVGKEEINHDKDHIMISSLNHIDEHVNDNSNKKLNSLAKLTDSIAKSALAKKNILGLDKLENLEKIEKFDTLDKIEKKDKLDKLVDEGNKDVVSEGLKQMGMMESKMKNIENNMDEIFQFYKSLGIEMEKPNEKENNALAKSMKKITMEKDKTNDPSDEEQIKKEEKKNDETMKVKKEEKIDEKKDNKNHFTSTLGTKVKTLGLFNHFKAKKN